MNATSTALSYFFDAEAQTKKHLPDLMQSEALHPVRKDISERLKKKAVPPGYFNKMLEHVSDLLKIDLRGIILNAWCASGNLDNYLDTNNYAPDETIHVPLAKHTIKSVHTPSINPVVNNVPLGEIKFTIDLELKIGGALLTIRDGKIARFSIGSCWGRALFKYNDFIILQREGNIPQIAADINLFDGISLRDNPETIHKTIAELDETK